MEDILTGLEKYAQYKITKTLSELDETFMENNCVDQLVKLVNAELGKDFINTTERFDLYIFIYKENTQYKLPVRYVFNDFRSKILRNPSLDIIESLKSEVARSKKLKKEHFQIEFYILPQKEQSNAKRFNHLFKLIRYENNDVETIYKKSFFTNPWSSFFIDSFNVFEKYRILLFGALTLLVFFYYRHQLFILGLPIDIIPNIRILSVLELYSSIYAPLIGILLVLLIIYIYTLLRHSIRKEVYTGFKILASGIIYIIIFTFIYKFYLTNVKKDNIEIDDAFLGEYFFEGYYPRFAYSNIDDDLILILGEANRKTFYYRMKDLSIDNNKGDFCDVVKLNDFEKIVIGLLKYSKYPNTKNIIKSKDSSTFTILDKNASFYRVEKSYCSNYIEITNSENNSSKIKNMNDGK